MPGTGVQKTENSITNITKIVLLKVSMGAGEMAQYTAALAVSLMTRGQSPGPHMMWDFPLYALILINK